MGKRKNTRDGVCVEEKSDPIEEGNLLGEIGII